MAVTKHSYRIQARLRELEIARGIYGQSPAHRLLGEAARLLQVDRHQDVGGVCGSCGEPWPCAVARWHQSVQGD